MTYQIRDHRLSYTVSWPRATWPQGENPALEVIRHLRESSEELRQLLNMGTEITWTTTITDTSDQVELTISLELSPLAESWLQQGRPAISKIYRRLCVSQIKNPQPRGFKA